MFDVRPTENLEDFQRAFLAIGQYFGAEPTPERAEKFSQSLPLERMHAAREDGAIVGGAGVFPFELAIPGAIVRCAGVTVVGVYPTHRRRGVLRAMMRAQLDDIHARGEPIAALWASEETIYGRYGYGMASYTGEVSLAREHSEFAHPLEPRGRVRMLEPGEALELLPAVWERAFQQTPGMFRRERPWWENRVIFDPPERRSRTEPRREVVTAAEVAFVELGKRTLVAVRDTLARASSVRGSGLNSCCAQRPPPCDPAARLYVRLRAHP